MFLEESAFCRGFGEWIVIRSEDYFYLKEADKFPSAGIPFCGLWFRGEWARQRTALKLSDGGWAVELWSSTVFCEIVRDLWPLNNFVAAPPCSEAAKSLLRYSASHSLCTPWRSWMSALSCSCHCTCALGRALNVTPSFSTVTDRQSHPTSLS